MALSSQSARAVFNQAAAGLRASRRAASSFAGLV